MRSERRNERLPRPRLAVHDGDLTVDQVRAVRADQAMLAAHYADRVEQARAAGQFGLMRHWTRECRRAAMECRLLGEQIRRDRVGPTARARETDLTLARLPSRR